MRRALVAALAAPALVLAGCGGDETPATPTTAPAGPTDEAAATEGTDGEQATTGAPSGGQEATQTASPGDVGDVQGGADGQAAADVASAFLLSLVNAEPEACDYLLSFTDVERPMTEVASDLEMCVELLPEVLRAETEAQGLDESVAAELEGLVIRGADVEGDTAVVDADNYPPDLAGSMGEAAMTLKRIDGRWYVDLDNSFVVPTSG